MSADRTPDHRRPPRRAPASPRRRLVIACGVFAFAGAVIATIVLRPRDHASELALARAELAASPEGFAVFGAATLDEARRNAVGDRFCAPTDVGRPDSPELQRAHARLDRLADARPGDRAIRRTIVAAAIAADRSSEIVGRAFDDLFAIPGDETDDHRDRAMLRAWLRRLGRDPGPAPSPLADAGSPIAAGAEMFWLGVERQTGRDFAGAIACFGRALDDRVLDQDLRYLALLHRGWCLACPEVCRLAAAVEDFAAAARQLPGCGVARLFAEALRCAEPRGAPTAALRGVGEALTTMQAAPWALELAARTLLAIAESAEPAAYDLPACRESSPLCLPPVGATLARILAHAALDLVDGVADRRRDDDDLAVLRVEALMLLHRHDDALIQCQLLADRVHGPAAAVPAMLRARVELLRGRAEAAFVAVDRSLELDRDLVPAWRCRAAICRHVDDRTGEAAALQRAADLLAARRSAGATLPDGGAVLAAVQLRRACVLRELGQVVAAREVLDDVYLGGEADGATDARIRAERDHLRALLAGESARPVAAVLFADRLAALPPDARALAVHRGWLEPSLAELERLVADGWLETAGRLLPRVADPHADLAAFADDLAARLAQRSAGGSRDPNGDPVLRLGPWLAASPALIARRLAAGPIGTGEVDVDLLRRTTARLDAAVDAQLLQQLVTLAETLGAGRGNDDARLLEATALLRSGQAAAATTFLLETQHAHDRDRRGRLLLACAALACDDEATARAAMTRGGRVLFAPRDVDLSTDLLACSPPAIRTRASELAGRR